MINHCVILSAISEIRYNWSEFIQTILDVQSAILQLLSQNIRFNCLLMGPDGVDNHDGLTLHSFHRSLIFTVLSPFLIVLWLFILLSIVQVMRGSFTVEVMKDKMVGITVVTFWLLHPDIAHVVFASLSCIDRGGESRLFHDLDIKCWQGQHQFIVGFVTVPSICFWIIGVPSYFFYVLRHNQKLIKHLEDKDNDVLYNLPKAERYEVESFMKRYGFLFMGVNLDYYYWEICVMLRKVAIIFATEFLSSVSGVVQVLVAVMIMVASIMLVIRHRPFEDRAATKANIFSQAV